MVVMDVRNRLDNIVSHLEANMDTLADLGYRTGDCLTVAVAMRRYLRDANIILVSGEWYCHYVIEHAGVFFDGASVWDDEADMLSELTEQSRHGYYNDTVDTLTVYRTFDSAWWEVSMSREQAWNIVNSLRKAGI
jgi:hypothetical protein